MAKRWLARYAVLLALLCGTLAAWFMGYSTYPSSKWQLTLPEWDDHPRLLAEAMIRYRLPLYIRCDDVTKTCLAWPYEI